MLRCPPPSVETLDDVDRLLSHLTLLAATERADLADLERETAALKAKIQERQLIEVGAETWSYEDYRAKATEALTQYAETHRAELLEGVKGKTRAFTHGEIAFRRLPAKLIDLDGEAKTTKARLMGAVKGFAKDGVLGAIRRWLSQFEIVKEVSADLVFRIDVSPDRKSILELAQDGRLKPSWLKRFNLALQDGGEEIVVKPAEQLVQSEPTLRKAA